MMRIFQTLSSQKLNMLKRIFEKCRHFSGFNRIVVVAAAVGSGLLMQTNSVSGAQDPDKNTISVSDSTQTDAIMASNANVGGPWSELLVNHSITDFCGLQDWHVRQGYQILRRTYAQEWPVSFDRLQALRVQAVEQAEGALIGLGYQNYNWYCSTQGQEAAKFFVDVWVNSVEGGQAGSSSASVAGAQPKQS